MNVVRSIYSLGLLTSFCLAAWNGSIESLQSQDLNSYGIYNFEVSTPGQLAWLARQIDKLDELPKIEVELKNDIVFGDDPASLSQHLWTPIAKFDGIFNGNGYAIYGLNIATTDSVAGLFGTFNGTMSNLTIANSKLTFITDSTVSFPNYYAGFAAGILSMSLKNEFYNVHSRNNEMLFSDSSQTIKSSVDLGGLVGKITGDIVDGCTNSSAITADIYSKYASVGGLFGEARFDTLKNSSNAGSITTSNTLNPGLVSKDNKIYVGGIAGDGMNVILNSRNSGNIDAEGNRVGGIVGEGFKIWNSQNSGTIVNKAVSTDSKEPALVGGIVGFASYTYECTNKGNVEGDFAGGITGRSYRKTLQCINEGRVSGKTYAGGIAATCNDMVTAAINKGDVEGDYAGGICGKSDAVIATSILYSSKVQGVKQTGAIATFNEEVGQLIGCFFDTTKQPGIPLIAVNNSVAVHHSSRGLPTEEMQGLKFAAKLDEIGIYGNDYFNGYYSNGHYIDHVQWTSTGGYPFYADSLNKPIYKILLDDSLYITETITDSKGLLYELPLAPSKDGRYFEGWFDSTGTRVTKTTVFNQDQTLFARYSKTITDSSLITYASDTLTKPVFGWDSTIEVPKKWMRQDSNLYTVLSTPGELVWYFKQNPHYHRPHYVVLGKDIFLGKDSTSILENDTLMFRFNIKNLEKGFVFDGGGHSIYGLKNELFSGVWENSVLRNLTLANSHLHSKMGAFASQNYGTIQNCVLRSAVVDPASDYISGLVYENREEGIIENSKNYADLTIESGTVDYITGIATFNGGIIRNVVNYGNITSDVGFDIAGITFGNGGIIENAVNKGNISISNGDAKNTYIRIAGIAVLNSETIKNSRNDGEISFKNTNPLNHLEIGGIVGSGYSFDDNNIVDSCVNAGKISVSISNDDYATMYVGGIAGGGDVDGQWTKIRNSVNEGDITLYSDSILVSGDVDLYDGMHFGGIAGQADKVDSCVNKGNITGRNSVGGILGYSVGSVKNVLNLGKVTGESSADSSDYTSVGGVVGICSGEIERAFNEGKVKLTTTKGDLIEPEIKLITNSDEYAESHAGGICGNKEYGVSLKMNVVSNIAPVTNYGYAFKVDTEKKYANRLRETSAGGIIGFGSSAQITNAYNWGEITSNCFAGGIVGDWHAGVYQNVYNTGLVKAPYWDIIEMVPDSIYRYQQKDTSVTVYYDSSRIHWDRDTIPMLRMYYNVEDGLGNVIRVGSYTPLNQMSTEAMQSDDFVEVLNTTNGAAGNSGIWIREGGYPIFNPNPPSSSSAVESSSSVVASSSSEKRASSSSNAQSSSSKNVVSSSSGTVAKSSSSGTARIYPMYRTSVILKVSGRNILIDGRQINSRFALFDMQGRIVQSGKVQSTHTILKVENPGTYLIQIDGDKKLLLVK